MLTLAQGCTRQHGGWDSSPRPIRQTDRQTETETAGREDQLQRNISVTNRLAVASRWPSAELATDVTSAL